TYTIQHHTVVVQRKMKPLVRLERPENIPEMPSDIVIRGQVADSKGVPLPGVSVKLKETTLGVSTDLNGMYSITLPDAGGTLVFSFIGFKAQEFKVTGNANIDVVLNEDVASLNEVV